MEKKKEKKKVWIRGQNNKKIASQHDVCAHQKKTTCYEKENKKGKGQQQYEK